MAIHPTAVIDRAAELDPSVEVGAYAVIDGPVVVGPQTRIGHHVCLTGWTRIGARCEIHPFAAIGGPPQDRHFKGDRSYCRLGDDCIIREYVSIHRGTDPESVTQVGNNCFLLAGCHVAHNAWLGDNVTVINASLVGGHVRINQGANISGLVAIHQFVRIGDYAMLAGHATALVDIPPFMTILGRGACMGFNRVGMRRAGFTPEDIDEIRHAHRLMYRSGLTTPRIVDEVEKLVRTDAGKTLLAFLRAPSRRGLGIGARYDSRRAFARTQSASDEAGS